MQPLLLVVELVVAVAMVVCILLQRSEGGALGMGGGGSGLGGLFSPRGAADTITQTTAILAVVFFLTCLGLNILALNGRNETSILDSPVTAPSTFPAAQKPLPAQQSPQVPAVPKPH